MLKGQIKDGLKQNPVLFMAQPLVSSYEALMRG